MIVRRHPCQQVVHFLSQFCCIGVVIALGPQHNPSVFFSPSTCTHSLTSHYFVNGGWFESDNYLIDNVDPIRHIPATIVQGRYDIVTPMKTAWDLHKVQPCTHPFNQTEPCSLISRPLPSFLSLRQLLFFHNASDGKLEKA